MNVLNRITDWLTNHPGFSDILVVAMIVLSAAAVALYLGRDLLADDEDEHAQSHRR